MNPVIEVAGLRKSYGDLVAVHDVSFDVHPGEIFGIVGPNGAGKTTTVECLQGLRQADSGRASVLGLDPFRDARTLRRVIGSQLQESALPDRITVWEALRLFTPEDGADPAVLLAEWGLEPKRDARFSSLSGGQRQRLFVALALVNEPQVVFLDEMTAGLDPSARRMTWGLVEAIRRRGTTVVVVTHFMDEAGYLCDRIAVVVGGKVAALDTPEGLVAAHRGPTRMRFTVRDADLEGLDRLPHVARVTRDGDAIEVEGEAAMIVTVGHALNERGLVPPDLRVEQPSLEDAYLALTGAEG